MHVVPGTFATMLLEMYEGRPELLLDGFGQRHPALATANGRSDLIAQVIRVLFSYCARG